MLLLEARALLGLEKIALMEAPSTQMKMAHKIPGIILVLRIISSPGLKS
jgi:hypothetical protein